MKEAKIEVMSQLEDWTAAFTDGWEYVTIMKNGYSVFQRDKAAKTAPKPPSKFRTKKK